MQKLQHPFNALDMMKQNVQEKLGHHGISFDWYQSEHCDKTFILMLKQRNTIVDFNVLFKPESYLLTAGNNCTDALMRVMTDKLDQCIYY